MSSPADVEGYLSFLPVLLRAWLGLAIDLGRPKFEELFLQGSPDLDDRKTLQGFYGTDMMVLRPSCMAGRETRTEKRSRKDELVLLAPP